jgi:hypothetical protein
MSMRPGIYPLSAIEPLRQAFGCHDQALINQMVDQYRTQHKLGPTSSKVGGFRDRARSFVEGERGEADDGGGWKARLDLIARSLGLLQSEHPINDDWKWVAWVDYYGEVASQLPEGAMELLHGLVEGRPLRAEAIIADGSYYAWLDPEEVVQLRGAIVALQVSEESLGELMEFHEELLEWLESCQGKALLLTAS